MKKMLLFFLAPIVLFSCKEDDDPLPNVIGHWDLVSIGADWIGEEQTGAEMPYQQTYQFRTDGTFTKTQKADDQILEATGSYSTFPGEVASSADVKLNISLNFTEGAEIAGGCGDPKFESLLLRNNNQLVNGGSICDHPILTYDKN